MDDAMFQIYPRRKASDIDSINQAIFEKKTYTYYVLEVYWH